MSHPPSQFSPQNLAARAAAVPVVSFPDLPVSQYRQQIAEAIAAHQVVIVAGETGSGKTTQLPKIALQLGRGVAGMIGHTQPRRLAARTVAERIAQELGQTVGKGRGQVVGYQVRFTDEVGPTTLVKLMTDGILLNEIQADPLLRRYDTLIIDEAHERSLNIDFILGYLGQLLPKRPDLKVIITSATIDAERFAAHFESLLHTEVPVLEVSGRTYPVELRYQPLTDPEEPDDSKDMDEAIGDAAAELLREPEGDILVFLPGERDIREIEKHLKDKFHGSHRGQHLEVIPLFARLSAADQRRIFEPHTARRIILATNIAETSLTVPGIRFVIDPGLARISRFSNKTKVQRLPIEPISAASANQRSGRAGRLADGIAIRLYSEEDFQNRPKYTEPEILRTSLASVILQMKTLGLGEINRFPFLDAPSAAAIRDGVQLLVEIGALDVDGGLTGLGRKLARLPIDPRLGRMLLEAQKRGCASEMLVVAAALSIQDVRERPLENQEPADQAHARFADSTSDFLTYLNLWRYLNVQQRDLSGSRFRRLCRNEYLHYLRFREWRDVVEQLRQMCREIGIKVAPLGLPDAREIFGNASDQDKHANAGDVAHAVVAFGTGTRAVDYRSLHQAILSGLLSNVGNWDETKKLYVGGRGARFTIWPGSGLAAAKAKWVMAAELVETSRLFARTVAKIEPEWIISAAKHLVTRSYSEPTWSKNKGAALVKERVSLYGLTLVADQPVLLATLGDRPLGSLRAGGAGGGGKVAPTARPGTIAALAQGLLAAGSGKLQITSTASDAQITAKELAREMFIRRGLVEGDWRGQHLAFYRRNQKLLEEAKELETRSRQGGLIAEDERLFQFFDERIPDFVTSAATFEKWWKKQRRDTPDALNYTWDDLVAPQAQLDKDGFPDHWVQGNLRLPLSYNFQPGTKDDGVTVSIPLTVLPQVKPQGFDWLIPGLLDQLCVAMVRALPKNQRRLLAPASDKGVEIARLLARRPWEDGDADPADARGGGAASHAEHESARAQEPSGEPPAADALETSLDRLAAWVGTERKHSKPAAKPAAKPAPKPASKPAAKSASSGPHPSRTEANEPPQEGDPETPWSFARAFAWAVARLFQVDLTAAEVEEARSQLPPHLQMRFVALDKNGKIVGESTSLSHLQKQLAKKTTKAVHSAVRQAVQQARQQSLHQDKPGSRGGVPSAAGDGTFAAGDGHFSGTQQNVQDFPQFPTQVQTRSAEGMMVRGYPGLVRKDADRVDLEVNASQEHAFFLQRFAVATMLGRDLRLPAARITTRWTHTEKLLLAAAPYPDTPALVQDAQYAAALALLDAYQHENGAVTTPDQYENLQRWAKDRFEDEVHRLLQTVIACVKAYSGTQDALAQYDVESLKMARRDVKADMRRLFSDGFLGRTDPQHLHSLPRYLQAGALRLQKAAESARALQLDDEKADQLDQVLEVFEQVEQRLSNRPFSLGSHSKLEKVRWQIEELRVSLFAQQLGTGQKVSVQRIMRALREIA